MRLVFTVDLKGNVASKVEDSDGGLGCLDATKPYEDALGDPDPDRTMTTDDTPAITVTNTRTLTQS